MLPCRVPEHGSPVRGDQDPWAVSTPALETLKEGETGVDQLAANIQEGGVPGKEKGWVSEHKKVSYQLLQQVWKDYYQGTEFLKCLIISEK